MLPTNIRCASEGEALEGELVLDELVLGAWLASGVLGVCCDGVAVGWVFGSWDCEGVPWAKAAGSITMAKTAVRIKLVLIVTFLRRLKVGDHSRCR
ncbi:MAG: hypothetical protein DMG80_09715 [Acidobacteria bacterium]|nr:MAG: hypothetical protein DMG80_09715 [Acidobacteriota bacterium]